MVALHGYLFNRVVHVLDGAVGSGEYRLGQPALRAAFSADAVKAVPIRQELVWLRREPDVVVSHCSIHFLGELSSIRRMSLSANAREWRAQLVQRSFRWCGQWP